jgi:hypothetical protein
MDGQCTMRNGHRLGERGRRGGMFFLGWKTPREQGRCGGGLAWAAKERLLVNPTNRNGGLAGGPMSLNLNQQFRTRPRTRQSADDLSSSFHGPDAETPIVT